MNAPRIALAALGSAVSCGRCGTQPTVHDASTHDATVATEPRFVAASLALESRADFAPGPPPGCVLRAPIRALEAGPGAVQFATAAGGSRALLAVHASATDADEDGGAVQPEGSGVWALDANGALRLEPIAFPQRTASLVASGNEHGLAVAASARGVDEAHEGVVALWRVGASRTVRETLVTQPEALVADLACGTGHCALAYGWRERYVPPETAERAAFYRFDPAVGSRSGTTLAAPPGRAPFTAMAPADEDDALGTLESPDDPAAHDLFVRPDATARLPANVLDIARVGARRLVVTAHAPTDARCQPGAWRLELASVAPDGSLSDPVTLAVTDARPVGVRIRALGSPPAPLVTWLDAPQCSDRFFVARAFREGAPATAALVTCDQYDVATDRDTVWLAARIGSRIRWYASDCSTRDR